jgi:hypothetical protein
MAGVATTQRAGERYFFAGMAVVMAGVVFAGFAPTFYLSHAMNGPALMPLAQLHGMVFSLWMLLFVVQPMLVQSGRLPAHRWLGTAGGLLAALMVVVGTATGLAAAARGFAPGGGDARSFLIIPLAGIAVFGATVATAIACRRRSDVHKRLILIANVSLLDPAIARMPFEILAVHPLMSFGLACLAIVALALFDLATLGRVHRATWVGGLLTAAWQPIALGVSESAGWLSVADWLISTTCGALAPVCPAV